MSMISYSATKQVRFKNTNNTAGVEIYDQEDLNGVNETQIQSHKRRATSPIMKNAQLNDQS